MVWAQGLPPCSVNTTSSGLLAGPAPARPTADSLEQVPKSGGDGRGGRGASPRSAPVLLASASLPPRPHPAPSLLRANTTCPTHVNPGKPLQNQLSPTPGTPTWQLRPPAEAGLVCAAAGLPVAASNRNATQNASPAGDLREKPARVGKFQVRSAQRFSIILGPGSCCSRSAVTSSRGRGSCPGCRRRTHTRTHTERQSSPATLQSPNSPGHLPATSHWPELGPRPFLSQSLEGGGDLRDRLT